MKRIARILPYRKSPSHRTPAQQYDAKVVKGARLDLYAPVEKLINEVNKNRLAIGMRPIKITERTCLYCNKKFRSQGIGHRICCTLPNKYDL